MKIRPISQQTILNTFKHRIKLFPRKAKAHVFTGGKILNTLLLNASSVFLYQPLNYGKYYLQDYKKQRAGMSVAEGQGTICNLELFLLSEAFNNRLAYEKYILLNTHAIKVGRVAAITTK